MIQWRIQRFSGVTILFNPWRGCTKISPGCDNCYAEVQSRRNPGVLGIWGDQGTRVIASDAQWRLPLKWDREAREAGERRRVFCASMADVFEGPETMSADAWQQIDEYARYRLWATIWCTPHLDWLLLTKRPENVVGPKHHIWAPGAVANAAAVIYRIAGEVESQRFYGAKWPPSNIWVGVSVEDQQRADERIPHLLQIPAKVRFLSCEPLLGPVDLTGIVRDFDGEPMRFDALNGRWHPDGDGFDPGWAEERIRWVIVGGESGGVARPMLLEWARSLRGQCATAEVPFFMKQLGAHPRELTNLLGVAGVIVTTDRKGGDMEEWPLDLRVRQFPT